MVTSLINLMQKIQHTFPSMQRMEKFFAQCTKLTQNNKLILKISAQSDKSFS